MWTRHWFCSISLDEMTDLQMENENKHTLHFHRLPNKIYNSSRNWVWFLLFSHLWFFLSLKPKEWWKVEHAEVQLKFDYFLCVFIRPLPIWWGCHQRDDVDWRWSLGCSLHSYCHKYILYLRKKFNKTDVLYDANNFLSVICVRVWHLKAKNVFERHSNWDWNQLWIKHFHYSSFAKRNYANTNHNRMHCWNINYGFYWELTETC